MQLIQKDRKAWIEQFPVCSLKGRKPVNNATGHTSEVLLLRALLTAAGNEHCYQQSGNMKQPVYDFIALSDLLDLDPPKPVILHRLDTVQIDEALSRRKLAQSVPVGVVQQLVSSLLPDTNPRTYEPRDRTFTAVQTHENGPPYKFEWDWRLASSRGGNDRCMSRTLRHVEHRMLLPRHCAAPHKAGTTPYGWGHSQERWYEQTFGGLRDSQTPEAIILSLFELLRHPHLLDCSDFTPVLSDFGWFFDSQRTTNRQVIGHVVCSVRRVSISKKWGEDVQACLDCFAEVESLLLWLDACILDQYWRYRLDDRLNHSIAWAKVQHGLGMSLAMLRYTQSGGLGRDLWPMVREQDCEQSSTVVDDGWVRV